MAGDLGELLVRYGVDMSELDAAHGQLQSTMGTLKKGVMQGAGMMMGGLGVGGVIMSAKKAVEGFADFDDAMTKSTSVMGDMSSDMKKEMSDLAREIGTTTRHTAEDAANAYFYLASAGYDAQESMAYLPKVAEFAQAGMFDMASATNYLADAHSALGLKVEDTAQNIENLTRVSDVLVKANTIANATVEEFSQALTNRAAASMRALNMDVEEGVAVLAAYASVGIKGSVAGQQLYMVLRDLQTSIRENSDVFAQYNVAVYDSAGNIRGFADILQDLEGALEGVSDEQRSAILSQMGFTDRSLAAISTILGMSDAIRGYEDDLRSAGGMTEEVAERQMDSFAAKWDLVKKKILDFGMDAFSAIVPVIEKLFGLIDALGGVKNAVITLGTAWAAQKFTRWAVTLGEVGVAATTAGASMGSMGGAASGLPALLSRAGGEAHGAQMAFGGMGESAGLLSANVGALGTALAGAAAAAGAVAIGWAYGEFRKAQEELEEAMRRAAEIAQGETEAQQEMERNIEATRARVEAQARMNDELTKESEAYDELRAKLEGWGMDWDAAGKIAATSLTDQSLAMEGIKAEWRELGGEAAKLSAEATLMYNKEQWVLDAMHKSGILTYRTISEAEEAVAGLQGEWQNMTREIQIQEALWGMLPEKVGEAIEGVEALPRAVITALEDTYEPIQEAGREATILYAQGLAEMGGAPPEEAEAIAAEVAAALTSADPQVRKNAYGTILKIRDEMVASGNLPVDKAKEITDSMAKALGLSEADAATVESSYGTALERIKRQVDESGKQGIAKAIEYARAMRDALTLKESPDISHKVPQVYEKMFSNLDRVFAAHTPDLERQVLALGVRVPDLERQVLALDVRVPGLERQVLALQPARAGGAAAVHFHIPGFFGTQRELDDLARRLVSEHMPRVAFATGGRG